MKNSNEEHVNIQPTTVSSAIRNGDEDAFAFYYKDRIDYFVGRVEKITRDSEVAWNIVQDTFIKLWLGREQIDPQRSLDGFVLTMAVNSALNARKRKLTHARYHQEQLFLQNGEDHSADATLISSETELLVRAVIQSMPPQRRKIFELSREGDMTYNEIAQRLNLSYGTVHKQMKLALQDLRDVLSLCLFFLSLH